MLLPPDSPYLELAADGLDAERVEALWRYRTETPAVACVLPDGRTDVVLRARLAADGHTLTSPPRLAIAGPTDRPRLVPARPDGVQLGLRLRPGWATACLGMPAASLRDTVLLDAAAASLLGEWPAELHTVSSVDGMAQALRRLSARFARRPGGEASRRAAVAVSLLEVNPAGGPSRVALGLSISERTLRRDVLAEVGLPMRTLVGLARFRAAMARLRGERGTLGDVALVSGYSDQAHMTREFRRFGGFTPGTALPAPLIGTGARS